MTKIPDDVMERAARAICLANGYDPDERRETTNARESLREEHPAWHDFVADARAAGEVFVAWEREQCAKTLAKRCDRCGGAEWLWAHEISGVGSTTDDTKYNCHGTDYSEMCGHVAAIRTRSAPEKDS